MEILDANIVIRFLLNDHEKHFLRAKIIIEKRNLYLPAEVIAEIVYVFEKVYQVPRLKINKALTVLFNYPNLFLFDHEIVTEALTIYHEENIDFVDALLVGYHRVHKYHIHTFDKKLKKLVKSND